MADADRAGLAEDRTNYAEDRTALANERTFAGWMRTGLAAVAVGVGFQALFRAIEPVWIAKALATLFILVGIFIFWAAERRACKIFDRLETHEVRTTANRSLRGIAIALSAGAFGLIAALWLMK